MVSKISEIFQAFRPNKYKSWYKYWAVIYLIYFLCRVVSLKQKEGNFTKKLSSSFFLAHSTFFKTFRDKNVHQKIGDVLTRPKPKNIDFGH